MAVLAWAASANAQSEAQTRMTERMEHYFHGEKTEGYVFLGAGLAAGGSSVFLYTRDDEVARGAAYPVAAVGVIDLAAGVVLLVRTDRQIRERREQIASEPKRFHDDESKRMDRVATEFTWLKWTEIGLIATGLGLFTYGALEKKRSVEGVGIGLAAQSAVMLTLDLFAAARADRYRDDLSTFGRSSAAQGLSFQLPVSGRF